MKKPTPKVEAKELERRLQYGLRRIDDRLFYARVKAGYSREDVAKIRCVSVRTVARWETRKGSPKNEVLRIEIASLYNASFPWLWFNYGKASHDFEQGSEFEYLKNKWDSLNRAKQIAVYHFVKEMCEK